MSLGRYTIFTKNTKGFAIVELVVYLGILAIVSAGSISLLLSFQNIVSKHKAQQLVASNATVALERMLYEIRSADAVNTGASTLNSSPGTLVLTQGATTTSFALNANALKIKLNSGSYNALTSPDVTVTGLTFYRYTNASTEMVRIVMTVSATVGHATVSETFDSAAVLLNSYD
jgi:type II secretory pathway pseudopilin PulG